MKKLQVICFYWEGERWQSIVTIPSLNNSSYGASITRVGVSPLPLVSTYVNNLFAGVSRFADREFDFICFTNADLDLVSGIEVRPFPMITKKGVLPRLYMFSEESGLFGHQVLCIDLDVVIVGGLGPLMSYDGFFCARSKFKPREEYKLDGDVMSFQAGPKAEARLWLPFIKDVKWAEQFTQGRERYWIRHCVDKLADRWDVIAPKAVLSYKRHIKGLKSLPKQAALISCHGYPRPHQVHDNWIKDYWI